MKRRNKSRFTGQWASASGYISSRFSSAWSWIAWWGLINVIIRTSGNKVALNLDLNNKSTSIQWQYMSYTLYIYQRTHFFSKANLTVSCINWLSKLDSQAPGIFRFLFVWVLHVSSENPRFLIPSESSSFMTIFSYIIGDVLFPSFSVKLYWVENLAPFCAFIDFCTPRRIT